MFETKGKSGLTKEKVFKVIRSITNLGREDSNVSSPTLRASTFIVAPHTPANPLINYNSKAELKKAQALMYQRMFDRPR